MRKPIGIVLLLLLASFPSVLSADAEGRTGHDVTITNFAFTPDNITIQVGESVTWANQGNAHTVTSTQAPVSFDSGNLNNGQSFTFTFTTAGTYDYVCTYHSSMTGTIEVEADDPEPVRIRSGLTTFSWLGDADSVQIGGEWDDWEGRINLSESDRVWSVEMNLDPGMYCYKFVVDGEWMLDPIEPYRGYCGDFENSVVRVPDASSPMFSHTITNGVLTVLWHAGTGGGAPESTPFALATGLWDDTTWTWTLDLSTLPEGKNTLHITGEDVDGNVAEDRLLPFWNGRQADFVWEDALIYMIMTDRFVNGDPSNDPQPMDAVSNGGDWMGGDFAGITRMIENGYFSHLGVNALWLTPFNTAANGSGSTSDGDHQVAAYHGYWPREARGIDQRLGSEQDLHNLISAAHSEGIRILGDFVVNHIHEQHPYYTDHPDWFTQGCICGEENCDWTEERLNCQFSSYMPDVNWRNRNASEQFIADVMWWIETFDLDGGRIDAVKHVEDLAITNLAVRINERFETAGTDYYLKGETAMGWVGHDLESNREQYETINRYIGEDGLDGQADFVLYHAVVDNVFTSGTMDYEHLDYWTARSQDQYVDGATMVPFIGSHDVPRFTSRADPGTEDEWHQWEEQGLPGQPGTQESYDAALQAFTWLLTTPGAAMMYQGDEYGEYGGADPDNRHMQRVSSDWNERESGLWTEVSALGRLRQTLEPLRRGDYTSLSATTDTLAYARQMDDGAVIVLMNRGSTTHDFTLNLGGLNGNWSAPIHVDRFGVNPLENGTVSLPPNSVAIYHADYSSPDPPPPSGPDGHCLIVDNLRVNETLFITLDLVNTCAKDLNYPGVNATADHAGVSGFLGQTEWYYLIWANTTYPHEWQLVLDETIPNGTLITLTFEASILSCGPEGWHDCPSSTLTHQLTVQWPDDPVDPPDNGTGNQTVSVNGCTDQTALNYDSSATDDDGSCEYTPPPVEGCTDETALNHDSDATVDDGSCTYAPPPACQDGETMDAGDGCNTCSCDEGEWTCTEMACLPDDGDSDSGDSSATGGVSGTQVMRVFLGVLALAAGAFLLTLVIKTRRREGDY
jgi:glycosidase/plastocyanin